MKNIKIAIADDHKYLRVHLAEILSDFGYKIVLLAENGRELIDGIAQSKQLPDICIIDINMPVMDGFAATREVKRRWPALKIIGYSINDEKNIIAEMFRCGADRFLNKDSDPKMLDETIKSLYKSEVKTSSK